MSGFTKGPWKAADKACWFRGQQHPDHGKITVTAGKDGVVANCYGRGNATLIAAAPELYEALLNLSALYEADEGCRALPEYIAARAALSKAAGEGV